MSFKSLVPDLFKLWHDMERDVMWDKDCAQWMDYTFILKLWAYVALIVQHLSVQYRISLPAYFAQLCILYILDVCFGLFVFWQCWPVNGLITVCLKVHSRKNVLNTQKRCLAKTCMTCLLSYPVVFNTAFTVGCSFTLKSTLTFSSLLVW